MKILKSALLLTVMAACTLGFNSCGSDDDDNLPEVDTSGKPRKDYGYLPNGKRLAQLTPGSKYSVGNYKFTYTDEGVIKEATDGYRTYTFSDDLSTVTKRRSGGQVETYALLYNKDGNLSGIGNVASNDVDTKNVTSSFIYEGGICVGVKQTNKQTVNLDGVKYEVGQKWLNGAPLYKATLNTHLSLAKYTCTVDNPLGQNSFNCALMLWSETDVRCILQLLGFLGKGPAKFITTREGELWNTTDKVNFTFNSSGYSKYNYNYYKNADGSLSGESCDQSDTYKFSYVYQ